MGNWWCSLFNADLALSIAMTTISTTLSIGFLPMNLYAYSLAAYGHSSEAVRKIDYLSLFISIVVVIGAVVLGLLCSSRMKNDKFRKFANMGGNIAGICLIIFSALITLLGDEGTDSSNNSAEGTKELKTGYNNNNIKIYLAA